MLQSHNVDLVLGSIHSSEDLGIVKDDHSTVSEGQSSGVVVWRKSCIEDSDADVAFNEEGGDAFPRIPCKLWKEEVEVAREEAEGLDKESLAAEVRVSAMKNNPVDGVAGEKTTPNIMAPVAKASVDMSQDKGDGTGTS
jgi:hypothetical protein